MSANGQHVRRNEMKAVMTMTEGYNAPQGKRPNQLEVKTFVLDYWLPATAGTLRMPARTCRVTVKPKY